ncbi:AraC family transcriptional regulator [Acuticoccus sediminis]|uniref:AraC family transcriptional regulator n=1 Tax=Acuticoccus sediminis TaxID=2184697 RepID=A0A8B2NT75_9HYPH|nr:AraC family transcriptional regulator [Acuticoccus sediminis]RAI02141.1 AraC family transcriptional regulator [Acuticoccus sediminis]
MQPTDALAALIDRHQPQDGVRETELPGVGLIRASERTELADTTYPPSCCLIGQGRKHVRMAGRDLVYDTGHYLVVGVELPALGAVIEASPETPYLCLKIELDRGLIGDLVADDGPARPIAHATAVAEVTPGLLDTAVRLLRLLDDPREAEALAPLVLREFYWRLLNGPQGALLQAIAAPGSRVGRIGRAVDHLTQNFRDDLDVDALARLTGMSRSSFFAHFRAVTAMTPLQYRTRLRLQEARRLMLVEGVLAREAGFAVGFNSPSQFSREYARAFGRPPRADVARFVPSRTASGWCVGRGDGGDAA